MIENVRLPSENTWLKFPLGILIVSNAISRMATTIDGTVNWRKEFPVFPQILEISNRTCFWNRNSHIFNRNNKPLILSLGMKSLLVNKEHCLWVKSREAVTKNLFFCRRLVTHEQLVAYHYSCKYFKTGLSASNLFLLFINVEIANSSCFDIPSSEKKSSSYKVWTFIKR